METTSRAGGAGLEGGVGGIGRVGSVGGIGAVACFVLGMGVGRCCAGKGADDCCRNAAVVAGAWGTGWLCAGVR